MNEHKVHLRDLARQADLVPKEAENLFDRLIDALLEHGEVYVPALGLLALRIIPARQIRKGHLGAVNVPETRYVAVRTSQEMRRKLKAHFGGVPEPVIQEGSVS